MPLGHAPESAVAEPTSAILPAVALIAIVPVASPAGGAAPFAPPDSSTRKCCPGWSVAAGSAVTCHVAPVAAAYWTLAPASETGEPERLKSSTKSFVSGAPALPPPP